MYISDGRSPEQKWNSDLQSGTRTEISRTALGRTWRYVPNIKIDLHKYKPKLVPTAVSSINNLRVTRWLFAWATQLNYFSGETFQISQVNEKQNVVWHFNKQFVCKGKFLIFVEIQFLWNICFWRVLATSDTNERNSLEKETHFT